MFSVYSVQGRTFTGTLDQWRKVSKVTAPARTGAIEPVSARLPGTHDSDGGPLDTPRSAIAAYTQTQQASAQRHPLSRVQELMSSGVFTVVQTASLAQGWQLLAAHAIGQAPVVDERGRLVGLLLRADLMQAGLLPAPGSDPRRWLELQAQPVASVMRTPVPSVAVDADIRRVAEVLLAAGLPGLPVADDHGAVIGFISRSDILRAVVADPPLELWA
ncbi:MAG: CBS domain-containing protein [Rubrivivax sp.]|nr:CBS domain-containing protein [Rubrivivax sp.]MDP3084645.1 CBS domain-containing protein [Rubrivivax sp.]